MIFKDTFLFLRFITIIPFYRLVVHYNGTGSTVTGSDSTLMVNSGGTAYLIASEEVQLQ
ncbi:MAG: hypothetical protein WCK09_03315 [Bacteroidota bacterium]